MSDMWWRCSPGENAQMSGLDQGNNGAEKKRRRDDDEFATNNADSGFLSAGNMQVSGEIRDSPASGGTTPTAAETSARVVDLSDGLNQLTLTIPSELAPVETGLRHRNNLPHEGHQQDGAKEHEIINESTWQLYYAQDNNGDTQLHIAIMQGYVKAALILIRLAPHPRLLDIYNNKWQSPLHLAVLTSQSLIVRRLILTGADPSLKSFGGNTALHLVCMRGDIACAKALMDPLSPVEAALTWIKLAPHPRILDTYNDKWQSPLELAVLTSQSLIVRRLILAGADPSLKSFDGNTALHLVCMRGDLACAKALTDPLSPVERNELMPGQTVPALPQNLEEPNYNGKTCLHLAAINGHVNLMRLLLHLGADLEAREGLAGYTALHLAMRRKCRSVFNFLLQECNPCLETRTYSRLTAYQLALGIDSQLARELVRYGAKPEPLPDSDLKDGSEDET